MRTVLAVFLWLAASPASADGYAWPVLEAIDGDTIRVRVPELPPALERLSVRIRGIDAPESGGKARCAAERALAERATDYLRALLASGPVLFWRPTWDKYGGRVDAEVTAGGRSVGAVMIAAGLVRPYAGGARKGWCG